MIIFPPVVKTPRDIVFLEEKGRGYTGQLTHSAIFPLVVPLFHSFSLLSPLLKALRQRSTPLTYTAQQPCVVGHMIGTQEMFVQLVD